MEMHQVRYFLAVARTLNFTRAAEECNVTQPSLTRAIQKLEDELGGLLFRRERSLTHLTELGRMMLPHLERTYEAAQAAKSLARGLQKAQVAPLALGVATSVASGPLFEVIEAVAGSLPGFELTISTGSSSELLEKGLKGDLDLMLFEAPAEAPDRLDAWQLFTQRYHFVTRCAHALAERPQVSVAELADETWIDCGSDGSARLRSAAADAGIELSFRHRARDLRHVGEMIAVGLGVAVLPAALCEDERLAALDFIEEQFVARVVLAGIAGRRRSPAAEAFVRAARARSWADR